MGCYLWAFCKKISPFVFETIFFTPKSIQEMPPTKKTIRILKEIKATLQTHFGEEIVEVILFGSRANGKPHRWSDYDLLILLKSPYKSQMEDDILNKLYDVTLKYNIIPDNHFLALGELNTLKGRQPIFINAMNSGFYA